MATLVVIVFGVAEGRLVWYSYRHRDMAASAQGVLLAERAVLAGHQVFREHWNYAEIFVLRAVIGAQDRTAAAVDAFLRDGGPGSYFVSGQPIDRPDVSMVRSNGHQWLYRRRADLAER